MDGHVGELRGPRLVWDTEAKEAKGETEEWPAYRLRAGIGLAVVMDYDSGRIEVFDAGGVGDLALRLEQASEVISFNGVGYDHIVLDQVMGRRVFIKNEVDIYAIIKTACGEERWPKGSWTLEAVSQRTLGQGKTASGAHAPALLSRGEIGRLVTYCYTDVWLTAELCRFMRTYGFVIDPNGKKMSIGRRIVG